MTLKFKKKFGNMHMSMGAKITLGICSIVCILLIASIISIVEFSKMSKYASGLISDNITDITKSTELAVTLDEYNIQILSIVGIADSVAVSDLDPRPYINITDSLVAYFVSSRTACADSLQSAYVKYVDASYRLNEIIVNDFVDTRDWYFTVLQPQYNNFRTWQEALNKGIYDDLHANSVRFDEDFYRNLMPVEVSVIAGIALCLLFLFFLLVYYVRPLEKMLKSLDMYRRFNVPYKTTFEGDDVLSELSGGLSDLMDENITLKNRLRERER